MLLGGAIGAAVGANLQQKISSHQDLPLLDVLERYSGEWDERLNVDEVDWAGARPGEMKDRGILLTKTFQLTAAPHLQPVSVERKVEFQLAGAEWSVVGYIDYELEDSTVVDLKVKAKSPTPAELASELDPTVYLAARRAEGNPAPRFEYHVLKKTAKPAAEIHVATRTDQELDRFLQRLALVSREIAWREETGNWQGAPPGAWYCSQRSCGYWPSCRFGGG